jgi:hypothetical protein
VTPQRRERGIATSTAKYGESDESSLVNAIMARRIEGLAMSHDWPCTAHFFSSTTASSKRGTRPFVLMLWLCLWPALLPAQCPALVEAAGKGDVTTVRSLLAGGASSPNCVDDSSVKGWTPLMAAAKAGSAAVIDALLKAHADVNSKNGFGATALDVAVAGHGPSSEVAVAVAAAGGTGREKYPIATTAGPEDEDWSRASREGTPGAYKDFLRLHPNSHRVQVISGRAEYVMGLATQVQSPTPTEMLIMIEGKVVHVSLSSAKALGLLNELGGGKILQAKEPGPATVYASQNGNDLVLLAIGPLEEQAGTTAK